jgi:hypothetical protein
VTGQLLTTLIFVKMSLLILSSLVTPRATGIGTGPSAGQAVTELKASGAHMQPPCSLEAV